MLARVCQSSHPWAFLETAISTQTSQVCEQSPLGNLLLGGAWDMLSVLSDSRADSHFVHSGLPAHVKGPWTCCLGSWAKEGKEWL